MNLDLSQHKVSPLVMVFLKNGQKILTLKRAAHKQIFPNKLSGFGGKIEPGEDIFTAVHREFTEETGLTITDLKFRGNFIVFMGGNDAPITRSMPGLLCSCNTELCFAD